MSTQQLIYESAVPVSSGRHGKVSVDIQDYGFSRKVNSVPLMAVEFPLAAAEYAIVFAVNGEQLVPVVILGARQEENLYVDGNGKWQATYVPAFVRRYPFVFATSGDGKTFTLCIDESHPGVNDLGKGQPLFDAEAKPTPYVQNVLQFLQEYRAQFERTQAFAGKVKALGLLEPMQAQFSLSTGEKMSLTGFMAIDRAKLKALSGDQLAELVRSDEMELIHLHLYSMRNFVSVKDKLLSAVPAAEAPTPDAAAAPPVTAA